MKLTDKLNLLLAVSIKNTPHKVDYKFIIFRNIPEILDFLASELIETSGIKRKSSFSMGKPKSA